MESYYYRLCPIWSKLFLNSSLLVFQWTAELWLQSVQSFIVFAAVYQCLRTCCPQWLRRMHKSHLQLDAYWGIYAEIHTAELECFSQKNSPKISSAKGETLYAILMMHWHELLYCAVRPRPPLRFAARPKMIRRRRFLASLCQWYR